MLSSSHDDRLCRGQFLVTVAFLRNQLHPGHKEEFLAAWTDLMQWTMQEVPGKVGGVPLYRDFQDSQRFFSPMAWQSVEAITAW